MNLKQYLKKIKQEKKFKAEYEKYDLAFEIGEMVYKARLMKGLTQQKLAKLVGTKQPSIARLENGSQLPSLKFLQKIARALDTVLRCKFAFMEKKETEDTKHLWFKKEKSQSMESSNITMIQFPNAKITDNSEGNFVLSPQEIPDPDKEKGYISN